MDDLEKILKDIPAHEGYSWDELKDVLDKDEKNILLGMAWAYESLDISPIILDESDILQKIKEELYESNLDEIKCHLMCTMSEVLISFGDNHPEED